MLERLLAKRHITHLDLDSVRLKVMGTSGWTSEKTDQVELEYRRFLFALTRKRPEVTISPPTPDVDEFWHQHILDTRKYRDDCEKIFGHYMDHTPGLSAEEQSKADERRRQVYADHYIDSMSFDRGDSYIDSGDGGGDAGVPIPIIPTAATTAATVAVMTAATVVAMTAAATAAIAAMLEAAMAVATAVGTAAAATVVAGTAAAALVVVAVVAAMRRTNLPGPRVSLLCTSAGHGTQFVSLSTRHVLLPVMLNAALREDSPATTSCQAGTELDRHHRARVLCQQLLVKVVSGKRRSDGRPTRPIEYRPRRPPS